MAELGTAIESVCPAAIDIILSRRPRDLSLQPAFDHVFSEFEFYPSIIRLTVKKESEKPSRYGIECAIDLVKFASRYDIKSIYAFAPYIKICFNFPRPNSQTFQFGLTRAFKRSHADCDIKFIELQHVPSFCSWKKIIFDQEDPSYIKTGIQQDIDTITPKLEALEFPVTAELTEGAGGSSEKETELSENVSRPDKGQTVPRTNQAAPQRDKSSQERDKGEISLKKELVDFLGRQKEQNLLTELHTHLMGMGSWKFWIEKIMKEFIPNKVKALKKFSESLTELGFYEDFESLNHNSVLEGRNEPKGRVINENDVMDLIRLKYQNRCSKKLKERVHDQDFHFTVDVVYSVETLKKCLSDTTTNIHEIATGFIQGDLKEERRFERALRHKFVVFNARKQEFEIRKGITNSQLLTFLDNGPDKIMPTLRNCFSMLTAKGEPADIETIRECYANTFTPQFYPRRYALKDDMYSQYLEVLEELMKSVLQNYQNNGVGYVELSVGFGDLVERPWVFKHLVKVANSFDKIHTRFLIGFGRDSSLPYPGTLEAVEKEMTRIRSEPYDNADQRESNLKELEALRSALEKEQPTFSNIAVDFPALYHKHISQMRFLHHVVFENADIPPADNQLMKCIVGFDYLGDEKNHPYCPFGLPIFIGFVQQCREEFNHRFGFRLHCGEFEMNMELPEHLVHMEITTAIIKRILDAFPRETPLPLRIGHGISFLAFANCMDVHPEHLSRHKNNIVSIIKQMRKRGVPIEVNLRSNELLIIGRHENNSTAVSVFSEVMRLRIVICTDNDGIWNVEKGVDIANKTYVFDSVAGEFARAIDAEVIPDLERADQYINNAIKARFDPVPELRQRSPKHFHVYRLQKRQ